MVSFIYINNPPLCHVLVPYDSAQIGSLGIIKVYDCRHPGNNPPLTLTINLDIGQVLDYYGQPIDGLLLNGLDIIQTPPRLPNNYAQMTPTPIGNLCYTDTSGNKLGYDNGVFKDEIPGACPMISANDAGDNSNSTESYYVPDPSIKMEL